MTTKEIVYSYARDKTDNELILSIGIERLAELLLELGGNDKYVSPCFCGMKIGHPFYSDHGELCKKIRSVLKDQGWIHELKN